MNGTNTPWAIALSFLLLGGCDASVANPGSISDETLDDPAVHEAIVNGMTRAQLRALNYLALTSAGAARELNASGSSVFGMTFRQGAGILGPALEETNDHWQLSQQARWVAEDGVRRIRATLGTQFRTSALAAQALLHVGFSNRMLGENMCVAVIDGGAAGARSLHFERADAAFTEAIEVGNAAGDQLSVLAARAGRATVRVWLGNWNGATADAGAIPFAFAHRARFSVTDVDQYNRIFWASANQPYRNITVAGTFYEAYFTASNDTRVRWQKNAVIPLGSLGNPWYVQMKFDKRDSPINLVTGREMRLIVAESSLRAGNWQIAVAAINELRLASGVLPATATNVTEAWSALKRERGIELWLEARRLGDIFRWTEDKSPGEMPDMTGRSLCFPIGQSELDANPNV